MDSQVELELLYVSAVELIRRYVGTPPPHAIFNPSGWVRDWARTHPNEAYNLASDLYQLLHRHFSS
jgi:hypothetical protein